MFIAILLDADGPEDVYVVEDDCQKKVGRDHPGSPCCTDGRRPERKPHRHKAIKRYQDDQPRRHVHAEQEDEHDDLTAGGGDVQELEAGESTYPRLETADVEDEGVGEGKHHEVKIQRVPPEFLPHQYEERQPVPHRPDDNNHRKYVLDSDVTKPMYPRAQCIRLNLCRFGKHNIRHLCSVIFHTVSLSTNTMRKPE